MKTAYWISMYSMRSYETGLYSILKDGNFQLTLSRAIHSSYQKIYISRPSNVSDLAQAEELLSKCSELTGKTIVFTVLGYGENAYATRKTFATVNRELINAETTNWKVDIIVSDIHSVHRFSKVPVIYNFNITKLPNLKRDYVDEFFEDELESISKSWFTTVLNQKQKDYIVSVRPELVNSVKVYHKCVSSVLNKIYNPNTWTPFSFNKIILWPFRLSDKAYQFDKFYNWFINESKLINNGWTICVTDPNESNSSELKGVYSVTPDKASYYKMLNARPFVVMLDHPDDVLHPGTIELFYNKAKVITWSNETIGNGITISEFKEIDNIILNNYDITMPPHVANRFVYNEKEYSKVYK